MRARLSRSRRMVIKIGSKSLTGDAFPRLAEQVASVRNDHGDASRRSVDSCQVELSHWASRSSD